MCGSCAVERPWGARIAAPAERSCQATGDSQSGKAQAAGRWATRRCSGASRFGAAAAKQTEAALAQAEDGVEGLVVFEVAHVHDVEGRGKIFLVSRGARQLYEIRGEIDAGDRDAATRECECMPARTTPGIEHM